jgi:hypothetical protein
MSGMSAVAFYRESYCHTLAALRMLSLDTISYSNSVANLANRTVFIRNIVG